MKSHEFAQLLLAMPNLPIFVPAVKEYDDDPENCPVPIAEIVNGTWPNDEPIQAICISYKG